MAEIETHLYTWVQKLRPIPIPELKNCDPSERHLRTRHFLGVNPPGYGLKSTKYMIVKAGHVNNQEITEEIKAGKKERKTTQKYLGIIVSEKGDLGDHIKEKTKSATKILAQIMTIGSQCRVGSESVRVQLELYDKCAYSSIFYGTHAWGRIKREEEKELEKLQSDMLKRILNLPLSTPYTGVLIETGIWPVMARINYATLMLFHSVINSNNRPATDIVLQQEKSNLPNTFYQRVSETGRLLDIDTKSDAIEGKRKLEWKKLCKERIQKSVRVQLQEQCNATKLRLVRNTKWGMKVYIRKGTGSLIQQVIKLRLSMTDQKRNFRNKYGEILIVPFVMWKRTQLNTFWAVVKCPHISSFRMTCTMLRTLDSGGK